MTHAHETAAFPPRRRRPWLVAAPLAFVVLLAAAWSGLWFFAQSAIDVALSEWRAREARFGRAYRCGQESAGGFPFRFEVRCVDPSGDFAGGGRVIAFAAKEFLAVAQVWQPTLMIGEMVGPLTVGESGRPPSLSFTWSLAQASLRGLPTDPERVSVAVDRLAVASVEGGPQTMLANANRVELHGRIASGSARDRPVLDLALSVNQGSAARLGELAALPFDADISGVLTGLQDLVPRSFADALRALQAADGRLDVTQARVVQGDVVATATGTLRLTRRGALDGELKLVIANAEKLLPALGIGKGLAQLVPPGAIEKLAPGLDRLAPGLGGALRGAAGGAAGKPVDALGPRTELEGKSAVAVPLRIMDGAVMLGPFKLTEIPPLY